MSREQLLDKCICDTAKIPLHHRTQAKNVFENKFAILALKLNCKFQDGILDHNSAMVNTQRPRQISHQFADDILYKKILLYESVLFQIS